MRAMSHTVTTLHQTRACHLSRLAVREIAVNGCDGSAWPDAELDDMQLIWLRSAQSCLAPAARLAGGAACPPPPHGSRHPERHSRTPFTHGCRSYSRTGGRSHAELDDVQRARIAMAVAIATNYDSDSYSDSYDSDSHPGGGAPG
jgi:hypothetical protein